MKIYRVLVFWGILFGALYSQAGAQTRSAPRVLVVGLSQEQADDLQREVSQVRIVSVSQRDATAKILTEVSQADALVGTCDPEFVTAGKKLRWIQVYSAGVRPCMFSELVESDIILTNAKIIQGPEIADHAMALLLFLTRRLDDAVRNMNRASWVREGVDSIELREKKALVIGMGGIGTQVAERAAAFGMHVLALDPKDIPLMNSIQKIGKPDQLHAFLPMADVVFMCAPHTPESEGMLGAPEFSLMKRGSYFVNVSRGKNVDTTALMNALRSGHLAGAGLDVVDPEPLPQDHPLWKLDNVVITPHVATISDRITQRRMDLVKENLRRFADGLPLRNVVDKNRGY